MNIIIKYLIVLSALMLTSQIGAQEVVLVNGVATKVKIENKKVIEVNSQVPGYMNGYDATAPENFKKVDPRLGTQAVAVAEKSNIAPPVTRPQPVTKKDKSVSFKDDSAELSAEAKEFIKKIAASVVAGEAKSVLLKSSHISDDKANLSIMRQRLESCKRLLEENGVAPNLILTSMFSSDKATDAIAVLLKK